MIFSTSNREVEISKANDDSYFRKSDVIDLIIDSEENDGTIDSRVLLEKLRELPRLSADNDLISRKAVLECIGMTSVHSELARKLRELPTIPQNDSVLEKHSLRDYLTDLRHEIYHELCKEIHKDEECPCTNQTASCLAKFRVCDANSAIGRIIDKRIKNGRVPCGITCADSVLEDIKAEINKSIINEYTGQNEYEIALSDGLELALQIIDKHLGKEQE